MKETVMNKTSNKVDEIEGEKKAENRWEMKPVDRQNVKAVRENE